MKLPAEASSKKKPDQLEIFFPAGCLPVPQSFSGDAVIGWQGHAGRCQASRTE